MPDTIETAIVAAVAVVVGAAVTAFASSYSARQKIAELRLSNDYKVRADYLSNARLYTQSLYVSLSVTLSAFSEDYRTFRNKVDLETGTAPEDAQAVFRAACQRYLEAMRETFERGASAFLTTELEERLLAFNSFLQESLGATEAVTKLIVEYGVDLRFMPFGRQSFHFSRNLQLPTRQSRLLPRGAISAGLGFVGIEYRGRKCSRHRSRPATLSSEL